MVNGLRAAVGGALDSNPPEVPHWPHSSQDDYLKTPVSAPGNPAAATSPCLCGTGARWLLRTIIRASLIILYFKIYKFTISHASCYHEMRETMCGDEMSESEFGDSECVIEKGNEMKIEKVS